MKRKILLVPDSAMSEPQFIMNRTKAIYRAVVWYEVKISSKGSSEREIST